MILLIDNQGSFTYNLYQYLGELGEIVHVVRNNQMTLTELKQLAPEAIVFASGSVTPEESEFCLQIIKTFEQKIPILGIGFGHQLIGKAYGATICQAKQIRHAKQAKISHQQAGLFKNLPSPMEVMCYHSLVIDKQTLPNCLLITATSIDDQEIMAIQHMDDPIYGLQFHPESMGTPKGKEILAEFLNTVKRRESQ
ncbi:anthranilate synthase component II [Amphibacillus sp. Q70]|uniref:anthranilate synthase component II n=1 Tax=Amphibacillus sp. Q70 TaxID=3453416 RepID=UPI003F82C331